MYYRNSSAALAVFAVDNMDSFRGLPLWISAYETEVGTSTAVFLIANKCDLLQQNPIDLEPCETWAKDNGYKFARTFALSGDGIEPLFIELATALANPRLKPRVDTVSVLAPPAASCAC
jgi:GTPase SAR1 family protein